MSPEIAQIRQIPARAVPAECAAILAAGRVAHVAFLAYGLPHVVPITYGYDPAEPAVIYLHAAHTSRLVNRLISGETACISVALLDGIVFSKTARGHSVNYRSVVCYGRARQVQEREEKARIYEAMIARYNPGRAAGVDYRPLPAQELDAAAVLAFDIERWSAKARRGGPTGPYDADDTVPGSAGVAEVDSGRY
jgi:nitroimidazol reductase NimA-like FMN-containing flavoprotein (pyridoxamine 5'-phosphate oxidase superfamily)